MESCNAELNITIIIIITINPGLFHAWFSLLHIYLHSGPDLNQKFNIFLLQKHHLSAMILTNSSHTSRVYKHLQWRQMMCNGMWATYSPTPELSCAWPASVLGWSSGNTYSSLVPSPEMFTGVNGPNVNLIILNTDIYTMNTDKPLL